MIMNMIEPQVGQQLVQQQILLDEAQKLGIHVTDTDVRQYLQTGPPGQVLFPGGKFIGQDKYAALIQSRFDISVAEFEDSVKHDIAMRRLESLITAGVTVGDQEVRDLYRKGNIKIKFDYAVVTSDDLGKQINPSDSDLASLLQEERRALCERCSRRADHHLLRVHPHGCPRRCCAALTAGDSAVLYRAPI